MVIYHHATFRSLAATSSLHLPLLPKRFHDPTRRRVELTAPKRHRFKLRSSKREKDGEAGESLSAAIGSGNPVQSRSDSAYRVRVSTVLRRMWELVGDDRWIVFVAFGALIGAAVRLERECSDFEFQWRICFILFVFLAM